MDDRITLLDLCESVLEGMKQPLDSETIWEKAIETELYKKLDMPPKDAYRSLDSSLKSEIEKPDSVFYHYSGYGFGLKKFKIKNPATSGSNQAPEKDLHPLLVRYISTSNRFNAVARTIETSTSQQLPGLMGQGGGPHPVIVGIRFPFSESGKGDHGKTQPNVGQGRAPRYFSFEVRRHLTLANLHQAYFEAVANSSWANEGYLVTGSIDQYEDTFQELTRLNSAFGIGVIRLNLANADESEIILESHINADNHRNTLNKLVQANPDFRDLITMVDESLKAGEVRGVFDKIFSDAEMKKFIEKNNIR